MLRLKQHLYDLIRRASCDLPDDVEKALRNGLEQETKNPNAAGTMAVILDNIELARRQMMPLCQDTGSLLFWVEAPPWLSRKQFEREVAEAIKKATAKGFLRRNCVDTITGRSCSDNIGVGAPVIHWRENDSNAIHVSLILKGGGCENVGIQYSLPDLTLAADRNLEGVRRCCLDAVWRAQGMGCAPGILGVCIGGDRATGFAASKNQFLRRLGQRNENRELAALEKRILQEANRLDIGPMGFGGHPTLLDVLIGRLDRLPASFFVTVSYMCWAFRRQSIWLSEDGLLH